MEKETLTEQSSTPCPEGRMIPSHVAIIMDGNGRWAQNRGLDRIEGHHAGTENIRRIIRRFARRGVKYLTLYAFSTENWNRPVEEVQGLMEILSDVIDRELQDLHEEGARLKHVGDLSGLSSELQDKVNQAIEQTKDNQRITVCLAFNYGGRADIVNAVRRIITDGISAEKIDEPTVSRYLYTEGIPDPDLIVRTAGELRQSNFLIWQAAYSEYYYTDRLWPDFDEEDVETALAAYGRRERRFGRLGPNGGKGS